jgi:alkylation response protein AidB-like acyl-CoA dehydrogenase
MEATASGDGYTLSGTKSFVIDGATADLVIVAARTSAGVSLFAVDGDASGLTRTALSTMDQTRKQAKLDFDNTPATLIGEDGTGWDTLSTVLDLAAVGLAAEQVGGAQFVLEMAVQYAKDRVQFGRPIGSFQAIKHKCADMLLEVESAKSAAYYGMWCASRRVRRRHSCRWCHESSASARRSGSPNGADSRASARGGCAPHRPPKTSATPAPRQRSCPAHKTS